MTGSEGFENVRIQVSNIEVSGDLGLSRAFDYFPGGLIGRRLLRCEMEGTNDLDYSSSARTYGRLCPLCGRWVLPDEFHACLSDCGLFANSNVKWMAADEIEKAARLERTALE